MFYLVCYGKNKMSNNIWRSEESKQLNEKLQLLEETHKQKMDHIKLSYQKKCDEKISSLRSNVKDCVLEILSYCPDAKREKSGQEMKEIEEIKKLKWETCELSVKEPTTEEITDENILENILKFRDNRGSLSFDTFPLNVDADFYWRSEIWKFEYIHEYYTAKEFIDIILNDYWYPEYNYKNFLSLFSNLLESWQKNWYSLFDLFFNNKIITKEKTIIKILLDFYECVQYILLNGYPKFDEEKRITKSVWKMHEMLKKAILKEKPEKIKDLKILLCKNILYKDEEEQLEKYYSHDLSWKVHRIYADGISHLVYLKNIYKKKKWAETEWEQKSRICEIFPEFLEWKSVLDTWFLYKNMWWLYWKIEKDSPYQEIYQEWEKILSDKKHDILEILPSWTTLIDYWCYKWDKAKSLLDGIKKPIKYLPVDVDENIYKNAWENVASLNSENITILQWIKSTWDITESIDYWDKQNNLTYMFTWWSIWNYQDETIKKILSKTFEPKDGYNLILDYYKAPSSLEEIENLLNCYDNSPTEDWFINWLSNLWLQPRFFETALGRLYWSTENMLNNYQSFNSFNNLKLFINEFLKFTVHYEFEVNNTKYFAKLWEDWKIIIYKYIWKSFVKCSNQELSYLKAIKEFPWKIVEWFQWIKDSEIERDIDCYAVEKELGKKKEWFIDMWYDVDVINPIKSKRQVWFNVKMWDEHKFVPANFKEWEFYPIEISRRFSKSEIEKLLNDSGREITKTFDDDKYQYMNLIVASKKKPNN